MPTTGRRSENPEIEVTPEMIAAGADAISSFYIGIREGYREDLEAAVIKAYREMRRIAEFPDYGR